MDLLFSWLFAGLLGAFAALMFMMFRRVRGDWLPRTLFAVLGLFSALMCLMAVAVNFSEGPHAWAPEDGLIVAATFVVLTALIIVLSRVKQWPYARNRMGDAARERDEREPRRERPFIVDLLGCLVIGVLLLVLLVVIIAFVIYIAG